MAAAGRAASTAYDYRVVARRWRATLERIAAGPVTP
jgi:hypothetical protein